MKSLKPCHRAASPGAGRCIQLRVFRAADVTAFDCHTVSTKAPQKGICATCRDEVWRLGCNRHPCSVRESTITFELNGDDQHDKSTETVLLFPGQRLLNMVSGCRNVETTQSRYRRGVIPWTLVVDRKRAGDGRRACCEHGEKRSAAAFCFLPCTRATDSVLQQIVMRRR